MAHYPKYGGVGMVKKMTFSVTLFRILFTSIGLVVVLAGLFVVLVSFNNTTEIRSKAYTADGRVWFPNRPCNLSFKPPIGCPSGYTCAYINDKQQMERDPREIRSRWGKCVANILPSITVKPPIICYDKVIRGNSGYQWPDGCRGRQGSDMVCTDALVPLTPEEVKSYVLWQQSGKQNIPGCGLPVNRPVIMNAE